jgi:hypothetical protein
MLGEDDSVAAKDTLYRCLDNLCEHKADLFSYLKERWADLFNASYDILLYDLTSTYFECDPPRKRGRVAALRLQPRQAARLRAGDHKH